MVSDDKTMFAKTPEAADVGGRLGSSARDRREDSRPGEALKRIRDLVTDHSIAARKLAGEAAARFPEHEAIQNAKRILCDGSAKVGSGGPEPSTTEDFDWLRHPPKSARGKWVALVGGKPVALAETLAKLTDSLTAMKLPKPALVHRID